MQGNGGWVIGETCALFHGPAGLQPRPQAPPQSATPKSRPISITNQPAPPNQPTLAHYKQIQQKHSKLHKICTLFSTLGETVGQRARGRTGVGARRGGGRSWGARFKTHRGVHARDINRNAPSRASPLRRSMTPAKKRRTLEKTRRSSDADESMQTSSPHGKRQAAASALSGMTRSTPQERNQRPPHDAHATSRRNGRPIMLSMLALATHMHANPSRPCSPVPPKRKDTAARSCL